ncbi:MAG: DNA topoisomerase IB [Actinobacteria bacterium]|nr:MAG: DNA topoisomerase IB [Actinomycetota bacterium]
MARKGGWRRIGSRGHFRYVDARSNAITDDENLERIRGLVIPPAWQDVWISPSPTAKLQATGVDAAGRRQYLYHADFRAQQEQAKFDRLIRFAERVPDLRAAMAVHMDHDALDRLRVSAVATRLINRGWFRVGSERYARDSQTYGITTLRKRHVRVRGHRIAFHFRAKHRAVVRTTLVDEELADAVTELLELPGGSRLFRYEWEGSLCNLTGARLNDYVRDHLGDEFTAKDFRTWGGTLIAAIALAERGPAHTESEAKRVIPAVMRRVGQELGNTPAVARSSYVSPAVIDQYLDGRTIEDFRPRHLRVVGARDASLDPEEQALLSLLRSWKIRRSRAAA